MYSLSGRLFILLPLLPPGPQLIREWACGICSRAGRKNWLFANTPRGAKASAIVYSITETAKENGLNSFHYLAYLFERLPNLDPQDKEALDQLLPWSETLPPICRKNN
ncbi:hypothetical protein TAMC210_02720 [Thermanaeromonas sp. C210]|nr:hypothetical protein TAMC210_02720 [Thermanaeromonas sp. C210]